MADLNKAQGSLNVSAQTRDGAIIVAPTGDIDLTGSPTLRNELRKFAAQRPVRMVVDLSGVSYMDSSGVATLVEAMQMTRRSNTKLVLCGMQDRVKSIFEIARLDSVFTITPDLESAMSK